MDTELKAKFKVGDVVIVVTNTYNDCMTGQGSIGTIMSKDVTEIVGNWFVMTGRDAKNTNQCYWRVKYECIAKLDNNKLLKILYGVNCDKN